MSDCCSITSVQTDACGCPLPAQTLHKTSQTTCTECSVKGKPVDLQTVKAMVVNLEYVRPTAYRFCKTPFCQVVYFAEDTSHYFVEADLRERVHQKHLDDGGDVQVCYCFQHTPNSIRLEMAQGAHDVAERITELTKTGRCACEIRNPQGSCCLGNVRKVVKNIRAEELVPVGH